MPPQVYPELFVVIGNRVPDLRERIPWGSVTPSQYREAGLPNITGTFASEYAQSQGAFSGAYYSYAESVGGDNGGGRDEKIYFDASRASVVYGRSTTVQPAAYTVRYLIRAR